MKPESTQKAILFDLDGTLTDNSEGITGGCLYAQKAMGLPLWSREELFIFIGPPLIEAFMEQWHLTRAQAVEALGYYREYYARQGILENRPYEGIKELLERLSKTGVRLFVATSKPEPSSLKILERFELLPYFEGVVGSLLDDTRTMKDEVILYCMEHYHLDAATTLMVGDRSHDVLGARAAGIPCMGELYGFGSRQELEEAGAVAIAEDMQELETLLMQWIGAAASRQQ